MPPAPPPQPQQPPPPPDDGVSFKTFSGLKNTISPENLTARQLARAQNVDVDDLGQIHRRRGRKLVAAGDWHSIFTSIGLSVRTLGVCNGVLVSVNPDFSTVPLLTGIARVPLDWEQVGPTAYFTSIHNSGQIDLPSLTVSPWGRVVDPSYQPGLAPGPADFWFSPVVRPQNTLGSVGGKLLGAPPLGAFLTSYSGRMYIASGRVLWATELYLYNYVDKNRNYRLFGSNITGLGSVNDGVYVGTQDALYFLSGLFHEHVRNLREPSGVIPGSMISVPGELVDPEGRRFPDLPRQTSPAIACMTNDGVVVGLAGGETFNLTRSEYVFPRATKAAAMYRQEDGMDTMVIPMSSGGTPTDNARFGDYLSAEIIRAGTPGQPGSDPKLPIPATMLPQPISGGE